MRDSDQLVTDRTRLESIQTSVQGKDLSHRDRFFFLDVLVQREALYEDLLPDRPNRFRRIILNVKDIDVYQYFRDFKNLAGLSLDLLGEGDGTWSGFKHQADHLPVFYNWVRSTCEDFFPITDAESFRKLRQWLTFDSRLNFQDVDYGPVLEKEYLEDEEKMTSFTYDEDIIGRLREIVTRWFRDFDMTKAIPSFGPGATATLNRGSSPVCKAQDLAIDDDLRTLVSDVFYFDVEDYFPSCRRAEEDWRSCKVIFVPKTPITNRVISAEPTALTWCQQGLKTALYDYLHDHRREIHVDLKDQAASRDLALSGSKDASYATIDISKASDYVTSRLVDEIFADRPDIRFALNAVRSKSARLPSGREVTLAKYSPMGSAVCFPVECIVFASVCEMVTREDPNRGRYCVYGDDIVVENRFYPRMVEVLEQLHFIVNRSKSFATDGCYRFREACGIEAFNGVDVTPLRIPRFFVGREPTYRRIKGRTGPTGYAEPQAIVGYTEYINNVTPYGYENLRTLLHRWVRDTSWYPRILRAPYGAECSYPRIFCIGDTATNFRSEFRTNSSLQRREVQVLTIVAKPNRRPSDDQDDIREILWFWYKEDPDEHKHEKILGVSPYGTKAWYNRDHLGLDLPSKVDLDGVGFASLRLAWVPVP